MGRLESFRSRARGLARAVGPAGWIVLAVALVVRIVAVEVVPERLPAGFDARDYVRIGLSLADGDGFGEPLGVAEGATANRPPGYPALLAGAFWLTGDDVEGARALNPLLGTLVVALLGLIAWQLWRRRAVAVGTMAVAAVYPPLVVMSVPFMSEAAFMPLMLGSIAAALRQREAASGWRWAALAGALAGAGLLTRTAGLILLPPLLLLVWRPGRPRLGRHALGPPLAVAAAAALLIAPWTVRNAIEFDTLVPVSTQGGNALAGAYNSRTLESPSHEWTPPTQVPDFRDVYGDPALDEAERSQELQDRVWELVSDHPDLPFVVAWHNLGRLLEVRDRHASELDAQLLGFESAARDRRLFQLISWSSGLGFLALVCATVAGAALGEARRIPWQLWLVPLLVLVTQAFVVAGIRYRLPADVILIPLAGAAGARAFAALRERRGARPAPPHPAQASSAAREAPAERGAAISQAGEQRSARIESLRALAALAVVWAHIMATTIAIEPGLPALAQLGLGERIVYGGAFGVYFFFALTGYLLFWPFVKRHFGSGTPVDLGRYALNRALRILPLYYVAVIAVMAIQFDPPLQAWARFLTFSENFSALTVGDYVGPAWSLVVELHFYLLLPLLAWGIARVGGGSRGRAAAVLVALGLGSLALRVAFVYAPEAPDPLWRANIPATFFFFVPGMLLALLRLQWEERPPRWLSGPLGRADVWILASLPFWAAVVLYRYYLDFMVGIAALLVVGACVLPLTAGRLARGLEWRPLAILGIASYSLYLWHAPLIEAMTDAGVPDSFGLLALAAIPTCLAVALVSYRWIEAPFLRLREQWSGSSARQTAEPDAVAAELPASRGGA